jgi:aarF domain-containing kinase
MTLLFLNLALDCPQQVDPHPGNVLIMPDNRLGLLDYGMVSRITDEERLMIATTIIALAERNKTEVARIYTDAGYRASWKRGPISDTNILHRFASFHLDRLDLSPVTTEDNERIDILHILHSVVEKRLPTWVEKSRRMGSLMLGTASQAARPISLSHEWGTMARQVVAQAELRKQSGDRT